MKLVKGNRSYCVDTCPSNVKYNYDDVCVSSCYDTMGYKYVISSTLRCVTSCSNYYYTYTY